MGQTEIGKLVMRRTDKIPRLAYDHAGDGDAVIFLHAISGDRTNWSSQVSRFGEKFHAISFDTRGYGDSDDYDGPFTPDDAAADLTTVLEHSGHTRAHLVGLSMGGRLILDYYERHPERVMSLTLCATFHTSRFMTEDDWKAFRKKRSEPLLAGGVPADIASDVTATLIRNDAQDVVRQRVMKSVSALHKDSYVKTIDGMQGFDRTADLGAISVPTLVIAGDSDWPSTPEYNQQMASQIPGASFIIIPGAAHMINMENPQAFDAAVLNFLKGTSETHHQKDRIT